MLQAPKGVTNPDDRRSSPTFPTTSGVAAGLIGTTEPKLSETVRRGKVTPPPLILAGRRLWSQEQVLQAAQALGALDDNCRQRIHDSFNPPWDTGTEES